MKYMPSIIPLLGNKFNTYKNYVGKFVLEVGCGREGAYFQVELKPIECLGIDISHNQIEF